MSINRWIKERIPIDTTAVKEFASMPVPAHLKRWWWALGGTPAYLFIVQIITGILLSFYYVPEMSKAYDSIVTISSSVSYGWYIRSIHKWSANFMIAGVILHMMRVFFTGSYRRPRELNWMVGILLLASTLFIGFTGYSLIQEQLSYWGITVVGNLLEAVPLVGEWLADFFRAGSTITQKTLSRIFILHAAVLPSVIILLLITHVVLMHALGLTRLSFRGEEKKPDFPFVPDHLYAELIFALFIMLLLTFLALVFPAGLGDKANPLVTPPHIKPEWYFYFAFRILKITSLTFAVLSIGAGFFTMLFWPFIDGWIRKKIPNSEASVLIGIVVVVMMLAFTVWEAAVAH